MRRKFILFAVFLALPSSSAQGGLRPLVEDAALVEPDQEKENDVIVPATGRRRASSEEGSASDGTNAQCLPQSTDAADIRDYLNRLVEESVSTTDEQLSNLAFFKTHKTGSSTLSSIFYRYGVRHDLQVAHFTARTTERAPIEDAFQYVLEDCHGRVDIAHMHIASSTSVHIPWRQAAEHYKTIMRDPDNINFVTIFRDARSHFLSYYDYFLRSAVGHKPLEQFLMETNGPDDRHWDEIHNPFARELGISTQQQLEDFVENDLPKFKAVLLTDRFDEGLMLLRHILGWRLIDMSYLFLNKSGSKASNKKRSAAVGDHRATFDELSSQAQNKIDGLTNLDRALYEAGKDHYEKKLAPLAPQIEADLACFKLLQKVIQEYLDGHSNSSARGMYRIVIFKEKFSPAPPF